MTRRAFLRWFPLLPVAPAILAKPGFAERTRAWWVNARAIAPRSGIEIAREIARSRGFVGRYWRGAHLPLVTISEREIVRRGFRFIEVWGTITQEGRRAYRTPTVLRDAVARSARSWTIGRVYRDGVRDVLRMEIERGGR